MLDAKSARKRSMVADMSADKVVALLSGDLTMQIGEETYK